MRSLLRSALFACLVLLLSLGCASMTERIVNEAMAGMVFEADFRPHAGGDPDALAALYEHLTKNLSIDVQYVPADAMELQGAYGVSYTAGTHMFIRLRQDLSVNGSIEVMAHEAAHIYQLPFLSRPQSDVFAHVVAAHVAHRLGVPNAASSAALYLRQHKPSLRMALDLEREIQHVANILTPGQGATRKQAAH